jgi:hypothetical protein
MDIGATVILKANRPKRKSVLLLSDSSLNKLLTFDSYIRIKATRIPEGTPEMIDYIIQAPDDELIALARRHNVRIASNM